MLHTLNFLGHKHDVFTAGSGHKEANQRQVEKSGNLTGEKDAIRVQRP